METVNVNLTLDQIELIKTAFYDAYGIDYDAYKTTKGREFQALCVALDNPELSMEARNMKRILAFIRDNK